MGRPPGRSSPSRGQAEGGGWGVEKEPPRPRPAGSEDPFPPPPVALSPPGVTLFARAKGERTGAARSMVRMSRPFRLQAQRRRRCRCLDVSPALEKPNAKGVPGHRGCLWRGCETIRIFRAASRVPLGTLYLLGRGPERACPVAAQAAGQSAPGPGGRATRARSSPAGHSWIPDKGPGSGEGSAALFALSPRAPSQQLSVPQRASPRERSLVWLASGRPRPFCSYSLSLAPAQNLF